MSATAVAQTPPGDEMDTVIVTGVRQSLAKGLENKRENTQVIESIVAEDIGKLPDNNVIEALQRVTGVQISNRGGGEADQVQPEDEVVAGGCHAPEYRLIGPFASPDCMAVSWRWE